jgi:hypothetical protein
MRTRTRTLEKKFENDREWTRLRDELKKVAREEFPVGTKVWWLHGNNKQFGVVEDAMPQWSWSTEVDVRNSKTGTRKTIDAVDLNLDTE